MNSLQLDREDIKELNQSSKAGKTDDRCRLCAGETVPLFELKVLNRHNVRYLRCNSCGSAQTETPYWLSEAYSSHLTLTDTGAARRTIHNLAACFSVGRIFGLKTIVDFGGGDGLLCRLLRDHEFDCYVQDKYALPTYAQGYANPPFAVPDLVCAFEVMEHFSEPRTDVEQLFHSRAPVVLTTTLIFKNQDSTWWYYSPHTGQHVFFYTRKSLETIADRFGYVLLVGGGFLLFVRRDRFTKFKGVLASVFLNKVICRLMRGILVVLPTHGAIKDGTELTEAYEANTLRLQSNQTTYRT